MVVLSTVLSFVALYRGHKRYFSLLLVLIFTELVEMFAQIAVLKNVSFVWIYHLFVPVECTLLVLYLRLAVNIKK